MKFVVCSANFWVGVYFFNKLLQFVESSKVFESYIIRLLPNGRGEVCYSFSSKNEWITNNIS